MKKMILLLLCTAFLLGGCTADITPTGTIPAVVPEEAPEATPNIPDAEPDVTEAPVTEPENTALLSVSVPATTEEFTLADGTLLYSYTAQHMELILPDEEVVDRVILNFLNRIDNARSDAESI